MKKIRYSFLLGVFLLSVLMFTSCEKFELSTQSETFFHVGVKGTELPVLVRGNTASNRLVVFINGGPGLTSIDVARADMFNWKERLEKEVAVVYYDQRGCGNAQGNIDEATISISQFVADLHAIVTVLHKQYPDASVYLFGHSFGSFIGANYLLHEDYQDDIAGWISMDGAYNFDYDLSWVYRREFLIDIATEELTKGNKTDHWEAALQWTAENPVIIERNQKIKFGEWIGNPGEIIIPEELGSLSLRDYLNIGFASSYNAFPSYASSNLELVNDLLNAEVEGINLMNQLHRLQLPVLFLWGKYDDLITEREGRAVFEKVGTPDVQKEFVTLPNSGHEPMFSDPEKLNNELLIFTK